MRIVTWSIRRIYQPLKQKELKHFLNNNKVDVMGIIEITVTKNRAQNIFSKIVTNWDHCCNYPITYNGRLWLLWRNIALVQIQLVLEQVVPCFLSDKAIDFQDKFNVIYASNGLVQREQLWQELIALGVIIWSSCLLAVHFNNVLTNSDRLGS